MSTALKKSTLLIVGAVGLFLLLVGVLAWYSDPKYYPLIGSLSVPLTALALWFGYISQANPYRVELHKRQIDAVRELISLAQQGCDTLFCLDADGGQQDSWKDYRAIYRKLRIESETQVILPNTVLAALIKFTYYYSECARHIGPPALVHTKDNTNLLQELERQKREFITICREALHTDSLTEETKRLLGQQYTDRIPNPLPPALADPPGTLGDEQSDEPGAAARWIAAFDAVPPLQMSPEEEAVWRSARVEQSRCDAARIERLAAGFPGAAG